MKVAVIILNYNSSSDSRKCVSFLKRQKRVELEIIIVDNASNSYDRDAVALFCQIENCTFIAAEENRGYNAGNNVGLRYAVAKGYKYAMVVNPDMEFPQKNYISLMLQQIERDEKIVVMGTDIIGPDGIHQNPMKPEGDWTSSFDWITAIWKNRKIKDAHDFIDNYQESHYCHKLSGCCILLRLNFIREIGYFDENVFLYCEEAILGRQVEMYHKRMYYDSELQAIHRHIKKEKSDPVLRLKAWKRSRQYYLTKYSQYGKIEETLSLISLKIYIDALIVYNSIKKIYERKRTIY